MLQKRREPKEPKIGGLETAPIVSDKNGPESQNTGTRLGGRCGRGLTRSADPVQDRKGSQGSGVLWSREDKEDVHNCGTGIIRLLVAVFN